MEFNINIPAIIVSVLANFILGFAWYTALFGKSWMKEMGYNPNMRPDKKTMFKGIAIMLIGNFLFAWVLSFYVAGWQYIPGIKEMNPLIVGLNSALSVWIGFFVPIHLTRVVWEKHSWKLFFINCGYNLVATIVVALVLSSWM